MPFPIEEATEWTCKAMKAEIVVALLRMRKLVHPDFTLSSMFIPIPIDAFEGLTDVQQLALYLSLVRTDLLHALFQASGGKEGEDAFASQGGGV